MTISITEKRKGLIFKSTEILVDGEEFKGLSAEAIILYSMLLKTKYVSFKNNWIDKDGRVFIYFTVEEIMKRRNIQSQLP